MSDSAPKTMSTNPVNLSGFAVYLVGGAVRDALLGINSTDKDYVVVGASPAQMLAAGFRPVGKDFPVFLHPHTHAEYALARTERKAGVGYHGFTFYTGPEVTLEQDLQRRDLTINAMAQAANGALIDPFGGQADLAAKRLRHVSPAFAEDPLRVLRVARFAARFADFSVDAQTLQLMARISPELQSLAPERVWTELARGLMEQAPQRMLTLLRECRALPYCLPGLGEHLQDLPALSRAAHQQAPLALRWVILSQQASDLPRLQKQLKVPSDCALLARLQQSQGQAMQQLDKLSAEQTLHLLQALDFWRRPQLAQALAIAADCLTPQTASRAAYLQQLQNALTPVRASELNQQLQGPALGQALQAARLEALQAYKSANPANRP